MFRLLYGAIFRSSLRLRRLYRVFFTTKDCSLQLQLLTIPWLEPHACIEHLVTSRPLSILHTTAHLRDTEVYPRLPGNLTPTWQPSIQRFSTKYYLRSKFRNSLHTTRHATDLHQALLITS